MKTLLKQLWLEPAVFGHALNAVLQIGQLVTIHSETVHVVLIAVGAVLFGTTTRSLSKPANPKGRS